MIESEKKLVTAGVQGCAVYDIIIKNRKYDPVQQLELDPDSKTLDIVIV